MQIVNHPQSGAPLTPYLSQDAAKGTVLILPGGGYEHTSSREAKPVADMFNAGGYNAFVLDYNVKNPPLNTRPLQDAAWAIKYIRSNAESFKIMPDKIAVCGFSAGGHLAASLGTMWHKPDFFDGDTQNADIYRPDALILSYPVISAGVFRNEGSFKNLVGSDSKKRAIFSLEQQVSKNTPPTFLWHTSNDNAVPVQNSYLFAEKLALYDIPCEMHIFPDGRHGMSVATEEVGSADPYVARWTKLCIEWLDYTLN